MSSTLSVPPSPPRSISSFNSFAIQIVLEVTKELPSSSLRFACPFHLPSCRFLLPFPRPPFLLPFPLPPRFSRPLPDLPFGPPRPKTPLE